MVHDTELADHLQRLQGRAFIRTALVGKQARQAGHPHRREALRAPPDPRRRHARWASSPISACASGSHSKGARQVGGVERRARQVRPHHGRAARGRRAPARGGLARLLQAAPLPHRLADPRHPHDPSRRVTRSGPHLRQAPQDGPRHRVPRRRRRPRRRLRRLALGLRQLDELHASRSTPTTSSTIQNVCDDEQVPHPRHRHRERPRHRRAPLGAGRQGVRLDREGQRRARGAAAVRAQGAQRRHGAARDPEEPRGDEPRSRPTTTRSSARTRRSRCSSSAILSLDDKATVETLFWQICRGIAAMRKADDECRRSSKPSRRSSPISTSATSRSSSRCSTTGRSTSSSRSCRSTG